MEQANIAHSLAAFAALAIGLAACGSSDARMRPELPSDVTTTTSAPTSTSSPGVASQAPVAQAPATSPDEDIGGAPASGPMPVASPVWEDSPKQARHAEAPLSDSEIAAVIDAAGRAERQLARETLKRSTSPRVRQLAQRVMSDHGPAKLDRVERGSSITQVDSPTSSELTTGAAHLVQSLQSSSDQDFDRVSLDTLANEERQLARLLDDKLIPQAQNGELRALLQELRASVASRIGMAAEIQSSSSRAR